MSFNSKLTSIKNTIEKVENSLNSLEQQGNKNCNMTCNCCIYTSVSTMELSINEDRRYLKVLKEENEKRIEDINLLQKENLYLNALLHQINYRLSLIKYDKYVKFNENTNYHKEFIGLYDIILDIKEKIQLTSIYKSNKIEDNDLKLNDKENHIEIDIDKDDKARKEFFEKIFFLYCKYNNHTNKNRNRNRNGNSKYIDRSITPNKNDVILIWKWLKKIISSYSKETNESKYLEFVDEVKNQFHISYEEYITLVRFLLNNYLKKE